MVLRNLLDKASLLTYKKLPLNKFNTAFSDTLYIAGRTVDSRVLDFISNIYLSKIKRIIILTPYSNLDKDFINSWGGLSKYLSDLKIDLFMKAPLEKIPSDVYFLDKTSTFLIPRNCFEKEISECCVFTNAKIIREIRDAFSSAEDFTHFKGHKIYHKKFNSLFQVDQRYLNDNEKEQILDAIQLWESSNFDDIEPLWRILEKKIRRFIKIKLEEENPDDWFSARVLPCFNDEIRSSILKLFEKSKGRLGIESIDEHLNPNEYLVGENYLNVMGNRDNKHLFKDNFLDKKNRKFKEYFQDCLSARNPSIHDRTPDEETELYSNIILKILMTLEWLNILDAKLLSDY